MFVCAHDDGSCQAHGISATLANDYDPARVSEGKDIRDR